MESLKCYGSVWINFNCIKINRHSYSYDVNLIMLLLPDWFILILCAKVIDIHHSRFVGYANFFKVLSLEYNSNHCGRRLTRIANIFCFISNVHCCSGIADEALKHPQMPSACAYLFLACSVYHCGQNRDYCFCPVRFDFANPVTTRMFRSGPRSSGRRWQRRTWPRGWSRWTGRVQSPHIDCCRWPPPSCRSSYPWFRRAPPPSWNNPCPCPTASSEGRSWKRIVG